MIWIRPGLTLPQLDAAFFDLDGVIIDASGSYRQSVKYATDWLVREARGFHSAPDPLVRTADIAAFKLAGGWNNDWDLTVALAALWTARLREWRGQPEAKRSLAEWAHLAGDATSQGNGGIAWLHETVPASAIPTYDEARWTHDEAYWGANLVRKHFGHEPSAFPQAPGLVHNERLLISKRLFDGLMQLDISTFAVITGRVGPEVNMALAQVTDLFRGDGKAISWHESKYGRSPFNTIISSDEISKPDPTAMVAALERTGASAALYAGDATDDLMLVQRYRNEMLSASPSLPQVFSAMIATDEAAVRHYQEQGADFVLTRVEDLPAALAQVRQAEAPSLVH